jgi:hypothetical protein
MNFRGTGLVRHASLLIPSLRVLICILGCVRALSHQHFGRSFLPVLQKFFVQQFNESLKLHLHFSSMLTSISRRFMTLRLSFAPLNPISSLQVLSNKK